MLNELKIYVGLLILLQRLEKEEEIMLKSLIEDLEKNENIDVMHTVFEYVLSKLSD